MLDILSFVDVGLVVGFIFTLEAVKNAISTIWNIQIKADVWKVVAFFGGYLLALIAMGTSGQLAQGFNGWEFVKQGFLYSGASTLLYQTGKLMLKSFIRKEESK